MRTLPIGEKLPSMGDFYFSVKEKGDSITFRIGQDPVYEGKHFAQVDGKWIVTECPRINNPEEQEECEDCNKYFRLMGESKKLKEVDKTKSQELAEEARQYSASIQFYFPVLNRDEKKFQVLRTTMGVKNKLDDAKIAGIKTMNVDWVLTNTGKTGRDRYSFERKDSADVKKFDAKEKEEYKKAKDYDMSEISSNFTNREDESTDKLVESAETIFDK